jgi:hypothetical protein
MRKLVVLLVWFALAGTVFAQGRGGSRGGGFRGGGSHGGGFRGGIGGARSFSGRSYTAPRYRGSVRSYGTYGGAYYGRRSYYGGSRYYGRGHRYYGRGFYGGYRPYYYGYPSTWAFGFGFGYSPWYGVSYPYYPSYYFYEPLYYGYYSTWNDPYDPYAYSVSPYTPVPQSYVGDGQWHRFSEASGQR